MSIINHQYRHVFIHVPKTAGTSMERQPWVGGNSHAPASQLVAEAPENYFSWGFVRHPCDRLLSFYSAAIQHSPTWPEVEAAESFEALVLSLSLDGRLPPGTTPQWRFLCDRDGWLLVDFVGRFERLNADWATVCRRVGVPETRLPHRNASRHAPWREVYSDEMIAAAQKCYRRDFEIFGYPLE